LKGVGELFLSVCTKRFVSSSPKNYLGNTNKPLRMRVFQNYLSIKLDENKGKNNEAHL